MKWLIYLLAVLAGILNPAQAGANSQLKTSLGQSMPVAIVVYVSGLLGVGILELFLREPWPSFEQMSRAPWWAWLGGLISIAATIAGISLAKQLGSGVFTGLSVTAALMASVVLDHYGWLGFDVHQVSWQRIAGCALMIAGLWTVARS